MNNLLTWSFWLNLRPPAMLEIFNSLFLGVLVIFLILSAFAFYFKRKRKIYRSFWRRFYDFSASNLMIGLLLFFFSWQEVPFLSARFWLILWFALIVTWLYFLIKHLRKIPKRKEDAEKKKSFDKYIPK